MDQKNNDEKALVIFQGKAIRRRWLDDEWWYSVIDVIGVLTESSDPRNYWKVLKHRLNNEGGNETVTNCNQLKMPAEDGKLRRVKPAYNWLKLRDEFLHPKGELLKLQPINYNWIYAPE